MNETTNPASTNRRLSARIRTALDKGTAALDQGLTDLADEYLTTAEGLYEDLTPAWQAAAGPALDALGDAIVARQSKTHAARKGEGAFSYAD